MSILKALRNQRRLLVPANTRTLVLSKGQIDKILVPGEHWIDMQDVQTERFDLTAPRFVSALAAPLLRNRRDLVEAHFTELRTGPDEVAVLLREGIVTDLVGPEQHVLFWSDAGPWQVQRFDMAEDVTVDPALARRLERARLDAQVNITTVEEGRVSLLFTDGVLAKVLQPGTHWFWMFGRRHTVQQVDLRWQTKEVTGQEILTKDRVSIRVNLTAVFRVVDAVKAVTMVRDHAEALHRAVQLAFRKTLGAMTLDRLLAEKGAVDAEAAAKVRAQMAELGIEVGEIALKDVILPGEMRDILNQVVAAQKEAEAGVIRRREETNATRSLLNTARVMADNPVMLRLKELEALETIAGKVERLTVHNGTEGLLSDLVKLRD
jgi:regulator of protease activity HflC (stomatin/prohibitin superfamily)